MKPATTRVTATGGFVMVALGAALWGTDAIFRRGLALELPAATLVFTEHLVLVAITFPLLWRKRHTLKQLGRIDWTAAVVIGAGSSAVATMLFTSAFRYGDPTTPLLLQKTQPLIAVAAASLLLGERLLPRFFWFLAAGLTGAYLAAFPHPTAVGIAGVSPALYALGAAALWGLGTVLGRHLTQHLDFSTLTSLRFAIGLPAAALIMGLTSGAGQLRSIDGRAGIAVVLLALVPGLAALLTYYHGLAHTPASAATLAELAFPLTAITINYTIFGTTLTPSQWTGTTLLAATITTLTWLSRQNQPQTIGIKLTQPRPSEA